MSLAMLHVWSARPTCLLTLVRRPAPALPHSKQAALLAYGVRKVIIKGAQGTSRAAHARPSPSRRRMGWGVSARLVSTPPAAVVPLVPETPSKPHPGMRPVFHVLTTPRVMLAARFAHA
eukprot:Rmarinus@m.74